MPPPKTHIGAYLTGGLKDLYHRIIRGKVLQTPDDVTHTNEKGHFWPGHDGPVVLARRYHVTEVLNTRGQSAVLVFAEDLFNQNRVVVIKILHTTYFNIGAQEAECLRRLAVSDPHHVSHTVKLLNTFVFGGHFCMVFESLSPHPITEVFDDLHIPNCSHLHKVKKLSLQLLVVLGFLRQQNTIHADLKPENILLKHVNDLSSVTVIDFGNSIQHVHKEVSLYYREFDVQTLLYRAPEVMFGIPFGTEIDMWSLGCILAELYLGRPLFFGKTKPELLASITSILGPLPKEVFQRGKYSRELATFTEDVEQEDATAKILECLEGSKDYAFANFLSQIFRYDPDERLSPSEAAQHPFLAQELCVSFLLPPSSKRTPSSILLNSKVYRHGVKISSEVKRQNPSTYDLLVIGTDRKIWDHGHHDTRVAEVQPYKQELDTDQHSEGSGLKSPDMFLNSAVNTRDDPEARCHSDFIPFSPSRKQLYEYKGRNDSGFYERMDVKSEDSNDYAKRYTRKPAFDLSKSLTTRFPQQVRGQKRSRSPKHVRSQTRSRSPLSQSDRHSQNYSSFNTQTVKVESGRSVVSTGTKHPDIGQCGIWSPQDLSPSSDRDKSFTERRIEKNSRQCPVKVLVKQDRSPAHSALRGQESARTLNQSHVSARKTVEMSPQRASCSTSKLISDIFSSEDRKSQTLVTSQQLSRDVFAAQHQQVRDFAVEGPGWKTVKHSPGQLQKKMRRNQLEDGTWRKFTEGEKHDVGKNSEDETKYHLNNVKDRIRTSFEDETLCPFLDGDDAIEDLKRCQALQQCSERKSSSFDEYVVTPGTSLEVEEPKPAGYHDNYEDLRGQRLKDMNKNIMEIIMSPKSKISRFNVSPNEKDGDLRRHEFVGPRSAANESMKSDTYKYAAVLQKSQPALVQSGYPGRRVSSETPPVRVDEDFILSPRKSKIESTSKMCPRARVQRNNNDLAKGNRSLVKNAYTEARGSCELSHEELPREEAKQMMAELMVPPREKMRRNKAVLGQEDRRTLLKADIEVERSCELSDEELSGKEARQLMDEKTVPPREKIRWNKSDSGQGYRRRSCTADIEGERSYVQSDEELSGKGARQVMAELTVPPREKMRRNKSDSGQGYRRRSCTADIKGERSCEQSDEELSGKEARQVMAELTVPPRERMRRNKSDSGQGYRRRSCTADIKGERSCEQSDEDLSGEKGRQVMFKTTVPPRGKTNVDLGQGDRRLYCAEIEAMGSSEVSDEDSSGEKANQMMFKTTVPLREKTRKNKNYSRTGNRRKLLVDNADIEAARSCEMSDQDSSGEKAKQLMFKTTVPLREKTWKKNIGLRTRDRRRLLMENIEATRSCEMSDDLSEEDAKRMMMETTVECEAVAEFSTTQRAGVTCGILEHSQHPGAGEQFRRMGNAHVITGTKYVVKPADGDWRDIDKKSHDEKRVNQGLNQVNTLQKSVQEKKMHEDERWKKIFEEHKHAMVKTSKGTEFHEDDVEKRKDKWLQVSFVDDVKDAGAHKRHAQGEIGRYRASGTAESQDEDVQHSSDGEEVIMGVVEGDSMFRHIDSSHSRQEKSDYEQVSGMPAGKYVVKHTNGCISSSEKSNHEALKVRNSEYTSPKTEDSLYAQRSTIVENEPLTCPVSKGSNRRERLERGRDFPNDSELEFSGNIHFRQFKKPISSSQDTGSDSVVDKSEKTEGSMSHSFSLGIASQYYLTRKTGQSSSETQNHMDDLESEDEYDGNDNHYLRTVAPVPDELIHDDYDDNDDDYQEAMEQSTYQNSNLSTQPMSHLENKPVGQQEKSDQCTVDRQTSLKLAPASQEAVSATARSEDMFNVSLCGDEASVQDDSLMTRQPFMRRRKKCLAKRKLEYAKDKKMSFQDIVCNTANNSQTDPKLSNKTNIRGTKRHVRKTVRRPKPIDTETDEHKSPCRKGSGKLNVSYVGGSTKNPKSTLSSMKTKSLNKRASMPVKGKRKSNQDQLPEDMQQGYHGEKRMRNGEKKSAKRYTHKSSTTQNIISNISNNSDSGDSYDSGVSKVCVNKRQRTDLIRSKDRSRGCLGELSPLASKGMAEAEYEQPALNSKQKKQVKQIELLKNSVKRFSNLTERSRKTKNSSPRHTALDDSIIFLEDPDFGQSSSHVAGHKLVVKRISSPSSTPVRRKKSQDAEEDEILFLTA